MYNQHLENEFSISTDKNVLDIDLIHRFLSKSYWATNIPKEVLLKSIENSLCFGVYKGSKQVGFARVITDSATFAYLADVFIVSSHRQQGLSKFLIHSILAHHSLKGLRRICLGTLDAQGLYKQFGFQEMKHPENWLEIKKKAAYPLK